MKVGVPIWGVGNGGAHRGGSRRSKSMVGNLRRQAREEVEGASSGVVERR
jgi:hypothetical protein